VKQTCVVLAGGLGTRLREAVADVPKCLAPVGSRSFLEIQIGALLAAGVGDIVLSLGHMANQVVSAVARMEHRGRVRHVVEPSLLGTGGAIAFALDTLGLDEVLVANGDTHLEGDISAMLQPLDRAGGELLRMAVVQVADRGRFGGVQLDAQQRVRGFLEKGQSGPGCINAGLYRLCRATLHASTDVPYSLELRVLPGLVERGAVFAVAIEGSFMDIGVPNDYFRFCALHGR
jgi:D-glycero-alpha-D-manno-heptose 1-phosphate guanylyltransferase